MRAADWISDFSGSLPFLFIHCGLFFVWIVLNTGPLARTPIGGWDAFPVRPADDVRVAGGDHPFGVRVCSPEPAGGARIAYATTSNTRNLKAELEIAQLHEKFDHLHSGAAP
jgi:uncharacterized membrane protein